MNIETLKYFISLKRNKKFSILLTIFSTIVAGFIIIFSVNPAICKESSSILIVLLSLSVITPLYLINQFYTGYVVSKLMSILSKKLISFIDISTLIGKEIEIENHDMIKEFNAEIVVIMSELTDKLFGDIFKDSIYSSPSREIAEIITILSSYTCSILSFYLDMNLISTVWVGFLLGILFSSLLLSFFTIFTNLLDRAVLPIVKEAFKKHIHESDDNIEYYNSILTKFEKKIRERKAKGDKYSEEHHLDEKSN